MTNELKDALLCGLDYMKRVPKNLNLLTDAISAGDDAQIAKNYYDLQEGFDWITGILDAFKTLAHIDYAQIMICKKPAQKIIDEYLCFKNEIDRLYNSLQYSELEAAIEKDTPKHMKNMTAIFNKVKTIMNEQEN